MTMGGPYFLSIDSGLTATKATVYDANGTEKATASAKTEVISSGKTSGISMEGQWAVTAGVITEALSRSGIRSADIAGIGVSGHGAGLYPLDARLLPVEPAFTSMDCRAENLLRRWERDHVSCYGLTRHHPWAGQPVPQLAWLKRNEKDVYDRIRWVLSSKDWTLFRLTGKLSTDLTDASNSGFVNLVTRDYDAEIFRTFGIPEVSEKLPLLLRSCETAGSVTEECAGRTGLTPGTPVVAGLFDVMACALGSGVYDEEKYSIIAGTWNINSVFSGSLPDVSPSVKCSLAADGTTYACVESSATSAGNLEWFIDRVLSPWTARKDGRPSSEIYAMVNDLVGRVPPGACGVTYLPFLYGSHLSPGGRASFIGLRPEHGLEQMFRAVYEGVVFAHRMHLTILKNNGLSKTTAVLSGGAALSDVWCGIFAAVTGCRIETTRVSQVGTLGAAIVAAVGAGLYSGYGEAVGKMVGIDRTYDPPPAYVNLYDEVFEEFLKKCGGIHETAIPRQKPFDRGR